MSDEDAPTSGDDKFIKTQGDESKDKVNNNKSLDSKESNNNSDSVSQNGTNANPTAALTSGLLAGFPNLLAGAGTGAGEGKDNQLNNVYGLIGNIQALLKAAVENNAKDDKAKGVYNFLRPFNFTPYLVSNNYRFGKARAVTDPIRVQRASTRTGRAEKK